MKGIRADVTVPDDRMTTLLRAGTCPDCGSKQWQRSGSTSIVTCEVCDGTFLIEVPHVEESASL